MILFSLITPDYESNLKEELFGCFSYIKIPFDVLEKMPIRDRKFYIQRHNAAMEAEQAMYDRAKKGKSLNGEVINDFAVLEQQNINNAKNR